MPYIPCLLCSEPLEQRTNKKSVALGPCQCRRCGRRQPARIGPRKAERRRILHVRSVALQRVRSSSRSSPFAIPTMKMSAFCNA
jgi:hypothetical protein